MQHPPRAQHCAGLQGRIHFCADITFSAQCLYNALRDLRDCSIRATPGEFGSFYICDDIRLHHTFAPRMIIRSNKIRIDVTLVLLRLSPDTVLTSSMLSAVLHKAGAKICPHLNTRSTLFGGEELTADCTLPVIQQGEHHWYPQSSPPCQRNDASMTVCLRNGECMRWAKCKEKGCLTRYGMRRLKCKITSTTKFWEIIILEVSRDILRDPKHSSWLAQIERESSTDEQNSDNCLS